MIPKIIHYCWFGGKPLPKLAKKCITSWRRFFPDYEILEWNEGNFDVRSIPYTSEAYEAKKYAFVSDYARFKILYEYGGLYFDTDVEVIRPMSDIIALGSFMGCQGEKDGSQSVGPGLGLGAEPGLGLYSEMLALYDHLSFINPDGSYNQKTVVSYTMELFRKHGLVDNSCIQTVCGINVYPEEWFCPINYFTKKELITENTRAIHHYAASWVTPRMKAYEWLKRHFGAEATKGLSIMAKKTKGLFARMKSTCHMSHEL